MRRFESSFHEYESFDTARNFLSFYIMNSMVVTVFPYSIRVVLSKIKSDRERFNSFLRTVCAISGDIMVSGFNVFIISESLNQLRFAVENVAISARNITGEYECFAIFLDMPCIISIVSKP